MAIERHHALNMEINYFNILWIQNISILRK